MEPNKINRVALVTAAGSGMGAACARGFARAGYGVAVSSSSGRGEELGRSLGGLGFTGSNRCATHLEQLIEKTHAHFGRIDVVVNSCSPLPDGEVNSLSDDQWQFGFEMVLMSVVRLARLVTPFMEAQSGGSILNISSFAAYEPNLRYPLSSVFRAGLSNFAKLYSDQYGPKNIRMNNILPGFIVTKTESEEVKSTIPMRRYGTVDEVARTALFLASEGGGYITGQSIVIDGGLSRSI